MVAHIPAGAPIVVEPVAPDGWGRRWQQVRLARPADIRRRRAGAELPRQSVGIEDYERTLAPALIGYYERHGYCWVVRGSTQSGRAFADPRAVPLARAYYRALEAAG